MRVRNMNLPKFAPQRAGWTTSSATIPLEKLIEQLLKIVF